MSGEYVAAIDLGISRTAYALGINGRDEVLMGVPGRPDETRSSIENKTATAVLLKRSPGKPGGWSLNSFGDRAEQEYLFIKSGEDEEDRNPNDVALFKYFMKELFIGGQKGNFSVDAYRPIGRGSFRRRMTWRTEPVDLEELEEPCGGPWGPTAAHDKFKKFVKQLLGCSNATWAELEESTEMFHFMKEWENKITDHHTGKSVFISMSEMLDSIGMSKAGFENARTLWNNSSAAQVGGQGKKLRLSSELVSYFFHDAVLEIVKEADRVLTKQPDISVIYLLGGFLAIPSFQDAVTKGLQRSGLRVQTSSSLLNLARACRSMFPRAEPARGASERLRPKSDAKRRLDNPSGSPEAAALGGIQQKQGSRHVAAGNPHTAPDVSGEVVSGYQPVPDASTSLPGVASDAAMPSVDVHAPVASLGTLSLNVAEDVANAWSDAGSMTSVESESGESCADLAGNGLGPPSAAGPQHSMPSVPPLPPVKASGMSGGGGGGRGASDSVSTASKEDSILEGAKAASQAAQNSSISGVPEVAMLVGALVGLVADYKGNRKAFKAVLQLCKHLTQVLHKAENLLAENSSSTTGQTLLEGVQDRVRAVVDVVEAYQRKNRFWKFWKVSMYRRRVTEAETAVRQMLKYLNTFLHEESLKEAIAARKTIARLADQEASLRRSRRVEELIKETEISENSIEIDRQFVLGSGGSSTVFFGNYDGVNAACKVITIESDDNREEQRKSFLREVRNMRRLNKSPRVVRVFGILTSSPRELVLVMEYMAGGDLFSYIRKHREQGLPPFSDELTRRLIGDIAKGLAHLHEHDTWHGDLKSLNILLTADNRASICDFGTSHWTAETTTKRLHSQAPGSGGYNGLSFRWAAPEVLEHGSPSEQLKNRGAKTDVATLSFMSDVYSFGVVVWEVLSREVPWANLSGSEMYRRVRLHKVSRS
eukprot:g16313.t2